MAHIEHNYRFISILNEIDRSITHIAMFISPGHPKSRHIAALIKKVKHLGDNLSAGLIMNIQAYTCTIKSRAT